MHHHPNPLWRWLALLLLAVTLSAFVTPAQAQALNPNGGTASGSLDSSHTIDSYSYTLTADANTALTVTAGNGLNIYLEFFDADNSSDLTFITVTAGTSGTLTVPHLAPGATYHVHIENAGGAGTYSLKSAQTLASLTKDAEPDDVPSQAHSLPINGSVTGHLGYSRTAYNDVDPTDWYTFVATKDGNIAFTETNTSALSSYIEFYDSDSSSQLTYVGVAPGATAILTIPHLAPGATYYIRIERADGYGSYTVSNIQTPEPIANDVEVDDVPSQAHVFPLDTGISGHLGYSRTAYSDVDVNDWYTFTMPQDGNITFSMTNDGTLNSYIEFYSSDGTSQVSYTNVAPGATGTLTVTHLSAGITYYLLIARSDGYGGYTARAQLNLPILDNDAEPNDTPAQAIPFAINSTVTGHLGYDRSAYNVPDTDDWYTFSAPRDGAITFTLTNDSTLAGYVEFYDSDGGSQLSYTFVDAGKTGTLTVPHLAPGANYYVRLARTDGYGGYTLSNGYAPLFVPNDSEVNDTFAQAVPLASLNNIPGHLGYSRTSYNDLDSNDWYSVSLPAGNFSVSMAVSDPLTAYLELYSSDGSQLAYVLNSGGNVQLDYVIPEAGTYYLLIQRTDGYGAYDLNQPVTATISGVISLEGIVQGAASQNITAEFRPVNGSPFTRTVMVGYNGTYFIQNVPRGKYSIAFKGAKWLRKVVSNIDVTVGDASAVSVLLPAGDANDDNRVDIGDFGVLINAFGGDVSDPSSGYDVRADFNVDGLVDIGDFGLMVNNYSTVGDL